jgi:electron transfer flavoprotein alpha subunit
MLLRSSFGCLGLQVLVADSDVFAHPLAEPWADLLRSVQQKGGYSHVIASSTSFGKNLLPRAAALLDVSPVTDVTAISEPRVFVRFVILSGLFLCFAVYEGYVMDNNTYPPRISGAHLLSFPV